MDFGRLKDVSLVDFTLMPDPAATAARFDRGDVSPSGSILLASPVWHHPGFYGRIYPRSSPRDQALFHYGRQFPAVELNTTWYGGEASRHQKWHDAVPDTFLFCPKLPEEVTHQRTLVHVDAPMESFLESIAAFGSKLGRAWFVLSPRFGPDRLADLTRFLERFAPRIPLAGEVRHSGWFTEPGRTALASLFEAHGVTWIMSDVASRRDALHLHVTADDVMIRFAGHALHPTDFTRLDAWAVRLDRWVRGGLRRAFFCLHQTSEDQVVDLAIHLAARLTALGHELKAPTLLTREQQGSLF